MIVDDKVGQASSSAKDNVRAAIWSGEKIHQHQKIQQPGETFNFGTKL